MRGRMTRRDFLAAAGAGLGLVSGADLLQACGGGSGGGRPSSAQLALGIGSQPQTLDVHKSVAGTDTYFTYNVFEWLLGYDQDARQGGRIAVGPPQMSADGRTFTFDLRPNVFFHNGDPVTAEDVQFSFQRYVDPKIGNGFAYNLAALDGVEILAPTRVAVHLKRYDAGLLPNNFWAAIVPKKYIQRYGDDHFGQNPVGTGPWRLVSRAINQNFVLERFDRYWGQKPGYARATFSIIPDDSTRMAALRSAQIDLMAQVPNQSIQTLSSQAQVSVKSALDGDSVNIRFNLRPGQESRPWHDIRVRQAMEYAIDRPTILRTVLGGRGVLDLPIQPLNWAWADAQRAIKIPPRPYDPDRARRLLADAGFSSGFSFPFAGLVNGRLPNSAEITQAVAGYWSQVGLRPIIDMLAYNTWISAIKSTSTYGVVFNLWGDQLGGPANRFNGDFASTGTYSFVADPQLDRLIADAAQTVDANQLNQAYVKVARYIVDNCYAIDLFALDGSFAVRDSVDWSPWKGVPAAVLQNARPA
jgi:peptide/nickel transport system substrate-binding protein